MAANKPSPSASTTRVAGTSVSASPLGQSDSQANVSSGPVTGSPSSRSTSRPTPSSEPNAASAPSSSNRRIAPNQTASAKRGYSASSNANRSDSLALNAAFMWEVKSVNEDLWKVVEWIESLCLSPNLILRRIRRLEGWLEQLTDLVAMQFALEEAYGYFEDPAEVEPTVSAKAADLRNEHCSLFQTLVEIVERLQEASLKHDENVLLYKFPSQFRSFMEQFRAHDRRECALALSALNDEFGVGD